VEKMAYPLPDKPSIAVLAFVNMSGDPEQEYFSDGLTEEIITTLSKVSDLFVIARQSTFSYKGKSVKISQVAEELGVQYVLEGSVRKGEDRVRITAQLIDALTGRHLWADSYDREVKDILAVQDEITKEIITALEVKLTKGEQARLFAKGTDNVEAWALGAKAWKLATHYSKENNVKAREFLEDALKLDPDYAFLWTVQAQTHFVDGKLRWSKSPAESYKRAIECAKNALALDPEDPLAHSLLGTVYLYQRKYDEAIAEGQRAITIAPNFADGYSILAQIMLYSGRFEEALLLIEKGIRLYPNPRVFYPIVLVRIYVMLGRYEQALQTAKQLLERFRKGEGNPAWAHFFMMQAYMGLGREEEARAEAEEYLKLNPKASLERWSKVDPYKNPAHLERWLSAGRKAGLPEKPPLPLPDKPSIAVLPFVNMSGDPEQESLSDGVTVSIIAALSKTPRLLVISRSSTFTYKEKPVNVKEVSRELGVQYVLEGSVQRSRDRVRITAQLIDATTGHPRWSDRYDRDLKDIFALQDEITMKIITALRVKLTVGEEARVHAKSTDNLDAYLNYLQAFRWITHPTRKGIVQARQLLEEAIALDPNYADAYRQLGTTHWIEIIHGFSKSPSESLETAIKLTQKAITLDDSNGLAYSILGIYLTRRRQYDKAIKSGERGYALEPNSAVAVFLYAKILEFSDRPQEALPLCEEAMRLQPIPTNNLLRIYATILRSAGRYEEGIPLLKRAIDQESDDLLSHIVLTECYWLSGRKEEARSEVAEVLRINPKFSLERYEKTRPDKNRVKVKMRINALRKAGLK
jgi:TolB-like protein/Flp pilus assembly protein TadD